MKKIILSFLIILFLLFSTSCNREKRTDDKIIDMVAELITSNWNLYNLNISYDEYEDRVLKYFTDTDTYQSHIEGFELNPLILEDAKNISTEKVQKFKNQYNYNIPDVKISQVYYDDSTKKKYIYINMVISRNQSVENGYNRMDEERNIEIQLIKARLRWKISRIQASSFLVELKDKLPEAFIKKYTIYSNSPVKYIRKLQLIND